MTNSKVASLHDGVSDEEIGRISKQVKNRLESEDSRYRCSVINCLKVAFANRPEV